MKSLNEQNQLRNLAKTDPDIYNAVVNEINRENDKIVLIASENYASASVLETQGSVFTNKYAEGYPDRRYYAGCEYADVVESAAINRTKALFGAEYANVQPHSGTQANMAVYFSVLSPGDTILGMNLSHGGHLSHGAKVNFTGKIYNAISYGVKEDTGFLDYDEVARLAHLHKPKMIICGASAYSRTIDFKIFSDIAKETGAYLLADIAHIAGLIAAGVHNCPIPYADFVTTSTHKTLRGPRGGIVMCKEEHGKTIDKIMFPGIQGGPLVHVIAAKAVALKEASTPQFVEYQKNTIKNAGTLSNELIKLGYDIFTNGTDNHLLLVDLRKKDITGAEAEALLYRAGITVNKNSIPYDNKPPTITSGIRLGTPAITTRGFVTIDMIETAHIIDDVLKTGLKGGVLSEIESRVKALCKKYPVYNNL
jgi:glycine hydroxymethyltransferase